MPFTDAQQKQMDKLAGELIRPLADRFEGLAGSARALESVYVAKYKDILEAGDNADLVDPNRTDLPHQMTVGEVKQILKGIVDLRAVMYAVDPTSGKTLIELCQKFSVNPQVFS